MILSYIVFPDLTQLKVVYLITWRETTGKELIVRLAVFRRIPEDFDWPELGIDQLPVQLGTVDAAMGRKQTCPVADAGGEVDAGGSPGPGKGGKRSGIFMGA
jgi:hypothetical protein